MSVCLYVYTICMYMARVNRHDLWVDHVKMHVKKLWDSGCSYIVGGEGDLR
jgi:hypothetical protein